MSKMQDKTPSESTRNQPHTASSITGNSTENEMADRLRAVMATAAAEIDETTLGPLRSLSSSQTSHPQSFSSLGRRGGLGRWVSPARVAAYVTAAALGSSALTATAMALPSAPGNADTAAATAGSSAAGTIAGAASMGSDLEVLRRDVDGDGNIDVIRIDAGHVLHVDLATGGTASTQLPPAAVLRGTATYATPAHPDVESQYAVVTADAGGNDKIRLRALKTTSDGVELVEVDPTGNQTLHLDDMTLRMVTDAKDMPANPLAEIRIP